MYFVTVFSPALIEIEFVATFFLFIDVPLSILSKALKIIIEKKPRFLMYKLLKVINFS